MGSLKEMLAKGIQVGAPIAGAAIGGPAGAMIGSGVGNFAGTALNEGSLSDSLMSGAMGAGTAAIGGQIGPGVSAPVGGGYNLGNWADKLKTPSLLDVWNIQ